MPSSRLEGKYWRPAPSSSSSGSIDATPPSSYNSSRSWSRDSRPAECHGSAASSGVVPPTLTEGLLDRFIIVPEHHLLFCFVEKVGSTSFQELFRRVRGRHEPEQTSGDPWFRNSYAVHGWTKQQLECALVDPSWHKAVFVRDPVDRFVSAWSSKCRGADKDGYELCNVQFGTKSLRLDEAATKIAAFDMQVKNQAANHTGASAGPVLRDPDFDPHWKLQSDFCGGLRKTIHLYNTVEVLTRRNSRDKVLNLLDTVGVQPSDVPGLDDLFPPHTDTRWKGDQHHTNVEESLHTLLRPDNAWVPAALIEHYNEDYSVFNMEPPSWINELIRTHRHNHSTAYRRKESSGRKHHLTLKGHKNSTKAIFNLVGNGWCTSVGSEESSAATATPRLTTSWMWAAESNSTDGRSRECEEVCEGNSKCVGYVSAQRVVCGVLLHEGEPNMPFFLSVESDDRMVSCWAKQSH